MYIDYNHFKNGLQEFVNDKNKDNENDYVYDIRTIEKTNQTRDAILRYHKNENGGTISPVIYIDDLYEQAMREGWSPKDVLVSVEDMFDKAMGQLIVKDMNNFETKFKDELIFPVLINTELNEKLLENIPHRQFLDMAITYCYLIDGGENACSASITNALLAKMNYTEDELYNIAIKNAERCATTFDFGGTFTVLSNTYNYKGAGTMLCKTILNKIYEKIGHEFAIIPSSIHEVLAIELTDYNELRNMVEDVNNNCVATDEILSNNVYKYDGTEVTFA